MTTPAGQPPSLKNSIDLASLLTRENAVVAIASAIAIDHFEILGLLLGAVPC